MAALRRRYRGRGDGADRPGDMVDILSAMEPRHDGRVTIYDVAAAAGVAPSTVSRTFTRPGRVSAATAAHVREVAARVGYPSKDRAEAPASARMLAALVSDIGNPFYAGIFRGAQLTAADAGYEVMLLDTRESGRRERSVLERVLPLVDGVVVASSRMPDASLRVVGRKVPLILVNRELRGLPSIASDNAGGVREAMEHLRDQGHGQVVYVHGPETAWSDGIRAAAVRDAAAALGMEATTIGPFLPTFEGGWAAAMQLGRRGPSSVIAYNDLMAIGLLQGLRSLGRAAPRDVSIVGFDDIPAGRLLTPALTTVAPPARALGAGAVADLLARISGTRPPEPPARLLPTRLIVRGTTGPARG